MILLGIIGPYQLLIILLFLCYPLVALLALISALRNNFNGNDKLIWVLIILVLPFLGSLLYFFNRQR